MDITKDLDVNERRSELENEAAKLLGQMLFAFSRLRNLGDSIPIKIFRLS